MSIRVEFDMNTTNHAIFSDGMLHELDVQYSVDEDNRITWYLLYYIQTADRCYEKFYFYAQDTHLKRVFSMFAQQRQRFMDEGVTIPTYFCRRDFYVNEVAPKVGREVQTDPSITETQRQYLSRNLF